MYGFCSPSHYNVRGGRGGARRLEGRGVGDLIWKFVKGLWWKKSFLHLWQDKPSWVELKTNGEVIFSTILLHFHYVISLQTANAKKSELFPLRISLENLNASGVTYWYPQIYNFCFRKKFLETLFKCIYLEF